MNFVGGYVGDSSDLIKIRRIEKQREEKRKRIQELKKISSSTMAFSGTRQFARSANPLTEQPFECNGVGLTIKPSFHEERRTVEDTRMNESSPMLSYDDNRQFFACRKQQKQMFKLSFLEDDEYRSTDYCPRFIPSSINSSTEVKVDAERKESFGHPTHPAGESKSSNIPEQMLKKIKLVKNPDVNTVFLPDRRRQESEKTQKEMLLHLRYEHRFISAREERIKNESLEVVYSYWNGTGHRRKVTVRKGDTIGEFLCVVRKQLSPDYREVRTATTASIMFIKEDTIIPHHLTFYELILTRARGKSGPLFEFGVNENLLVQNDITLESCESHAGKVVERQWFEKNKNSFPASRWEIYDPPSPNSIRKSLHQRVFT